MPKIQSTNLNRKIIKAFDRLDLWATNPWRRISLFLITFLSAFLLGSSIGTINGALSLMDPVGALISVFIIELMVRARNNANIFRGLPLILKLVDLARFGFLYGLLMEGFKLF